MIIIAVVSLMVILVSFALQTAGSALYQEQYFNKIYSYQQAYYVSKSVYEALPVIFLNDDEKSDNLSEIWASVIPSFTIGNAGVEVVITDENRKFNLNSLEESLNNNAVQPVTVFRRILKTSGCDPDIVNTALDWIDKDSQARAPGGREEQYTESVYAKNSSFDSIEELLCFPGISNGNFSSKNTNGKTRSGLEDMCTVYGNKKININTASVDVLQALDDAIDPQIAGEIISKRKEKPFKDINDLLEINKIDLNLIYRINSICSVTSDVYKIWIKVNIEGESFSFVYIAKRTKNVLQLICFFNE